MSLILTIYFDKLMASQRYNNRMHWDCRKRHRFCEEKEPKKLRPSRQPVMRALCIKRLTAVAHHATLNE